MCPQGGQLLDQSGSLASFWGQTSALTRRSFRNMYRDLGYYWLRLIIYIALGVSIGTVFQNVGTSWNSIRVSRVLYLWTPMPTTWFVSIFIATECNHCQNARQFLSMWWTESITLWKNYLTFSWIPSQYFSPIRTLLVQCLKFWRLCYGALAVESRQHDIHDGIPHIHVDRWLSIFCRRPEGNITSPCQLPHQELVVSSC